MSTQDENLIFVIDCEKESIREMNKSDLCDFLNEMQRNKKNYKEKKYLFCPSREAAFYVATGCEELEGAE